MVVTILAGLAIAVLLAVAALRFVPGPFIRLVRAIRAVRAIVVGWSLVLLASVLLAAGGQLFWAGVLLLALLLVAGWDQFGDDIREVLPT